MLFDQPNEILRKLALHPVFKSFVLCGVQEKSQLPFDVLLGYFRDAFLSCSCRYRKRVWPPSSSAVISFVIKFACGFIGWWTIVNINAANHTDKVSDVCLRPSRSILGSLLISIEQSLCFGASYPKVHR